MASDSTFSPTPFSPFSSYSVASGATSDDAPDLGAFTTVFRALNTLQTRTGTIPLVDVESATPTSSLAFSPSDFDSVLAGGSTVWADGPVASYLSYSSPDSASRGRSRPPSETESTASDVGGTDLLDGRSEVDVTMEGLSYVGTDTADQPSLGLFDEAFSFLAAERARMIAQRERGAQKTTSSTGIITATTSDAALRQALQPRRRRKRRKNQSVHDVSRVHLQGEDVNGELLTAATPQDDEDVSEASSSADVLSSSLLFRPDAIPGTPTSKESRRQRAGGSSEKPRLHHSKSTPTLRLQPSMPFDARVIQLRTLAHKLRLLFPDDAAALSSILAINNPEHSDSSSSSFVDTRGPVPIAQDTLIHVFIDHSNILIGFLSYLKRHLHHIVRKGGHAKHMHLSHAALALILERGRPITRRVLVASSPLYQPMESAAQLGYEVRVYARVPDTGDGADRQHKQQLYDPSSDSSAHKSRSRKASAPYGHVRGHTRGHSKGSIGGAGTSESETGNGTGNSSGSGNGNGARVRYREQGVDELLQLKVHQAIAAVDVPPPGATIVLATGDGNVGQFNEEGFLGCVRTALKKGWRVELYAWEGGLSRAWMREFGEGPFARNFAVHMLDRYAQDLLEV